MKKTIVVQALSTQIFFDFLFPYNLNQLSGNYKAMDPQQQFYLNVRQQVLHELSQSQNQYYTMCSPQSQLFVPETSQFNYLYSPYHQDMQYYCLLNPQSQAVSQSVQSHPVYFGDNNFRMPYTPQTQNVILIQNQLTKNPVPVLTKNSQSDKETLPNRVQPESRFGKSKRKHSNYYWSEKEHELYCEFLEQHSDLFELSAKERKNLKINVLMSRKVKSRSAIQCHTHHQKMIKKYGSIQNIIKQKSEKGLGSWGLNDSHSNASFEEQKKIDVEKENIAQINDANSD